MGAGPSRTVFCESMAGPADSSRWEGGGVLSLFFPFPLSLPQTLSWHDLAGGGCFGVAPWECWAAGHSCLWLGPGEGGKEVAKGIPADASRGSREMLSLFPSLSQGCLGLPAGMFPVEI